MLFAAVYPATACSPCLSRKLLAVDAAFRASENETDDGFFLKSLAVFKAACFCVHVVPPPAAGGGLAVFIFANRDCNSPNCGPLPAGRVAGGGGANPPVREGMGGDAVLVLAGRGGDAVVREGGGNGGALLPISKPGTDTPASPKRLVAPSFSIPREGSVTGGLSLYGGGGEGGMLEDEGFRGGNRGGSAGLGLPLGVATGDSLLSPGLNAGGFGRCAVLNPVVSALYGPEGTGGASICRAASSLSR